MKLTPDEHSEMKIHKNYTYFNCILECSLYYALDKNNSTCVPWYMPSPNKTITLCDPWQAKDFFKTMTNEIPDDACNHCLPGTILVFPLYSIF